MAQIYNIVTKFSKKSSLVCTCVRGKITIPFIDMTTRSLLFTSEVSQLLMMKNSFANVDALILNRCYQIVLRDNTSPDNQKD